MTGMRDVTTCAEIVPYLLDYTPPLLHRSSAKKKGGGRLIEVLHLCPELTPPHPTLQSNFRVTVYTARLMQSLVVATK